MLTFDLEPLSALGLCIPRKLFVSISAKIHFHAWVSISGTPLLKIFIPRE